MMSLFTKIVLVSCIGIMGMGCTPPSIDQVLEGSKAYYDPEAKWGKETFSLHIQEPRPQTPLRYSELFLDVQSGAFKLRRDYEIGEIERIISAEGNPEILVNGLPEFTDEEAEQYRLSLESNFGYRNFYQTINGLPMSLTEDIVESFDGMRERTFENQKVYSLVLELKEPMITRKWELMVARKDYSLVALRFHKAESDEREDEMIIFDGEYEQDGVKVPRFRHWYTAESREYLGSDVIVKYIHHD